MVLALTRTKRLNDAPDSVSIGGSEGREGFCGGRSSTMTGMARSTRFW
jgi:hypothetical protein